MNINERIIIRILEILDKLNNDEKFKKNCPDITATEYLCAKVHNHITPKRLVNILTGKAKEITLSEVICIAKALNVEVNELFKEEK